MLRLALSLCCLVVGVLGWINDYDQPFHFQCPDNEFLNHVSSVHDNHKEDRVWDFGCSPLPLTETSAPTCQWTNNYVNEYDQPLTYQCPNDGYITGIESVHDNHKEDRVFKFQCCNVKGAVTHACYYTNWENELDHPLDYIVPGGKILRGITSFHDNHHEDRRFKFDICDFGFLGDA